MPCFFWQTWENTLVGGRSASTDRWPLCGLSKQLSSSQLSPFQLNDQQPSPSLFALDAKSQWPNGPFWPSESSGMVDSSHKPHHMVLIFQANNYFLQDHVFGGCDPHCRIWDSQVLLRRTLLAGVGAQRSGWDLEWQLANHRTSSTRWDSIDSEDYRKAGCSFPSTECGCVCVYT